MIKSIFLALLILVCSCNFFSGKKSPAPPRESKPGIPTIAILYTERSDNSVEEYENLLDVAKFAREYFEQNTGNRLEANLVMVDDKDSPVEAEKALRNLSNSVNLIGVIGPLYSRVAMGLKGFINEMKIPLIATFATHNDLTKNSEYIFRICASNERLVIAMANHLKPVVLKNQLNIVSFKDVTDDYSIDLADSFRKHMAGDKSSYHEISIKGLPGVESLKDIDSKAYKPTKKDILFLPNRDLIAGKILAALESEPYMVAVIDTVNFLPLMERIKKHKTYLKLTTTFQWIPQKSPMSIDVEEKFLKRFGHPMTITGALTFDATLAMAQAINRSKKSSQKLFEALRDGTTVTGVTGNITLGKDGERSASHEFIKEDILK